MEIFKFFSFPEFFLLLVNILFKIILFLVGESCFIMMKYFWNFIIMENYLCLKIFFFVEKWKILILRIFNWKYFSWVVQFLRNLTNWTEGGVMMLLGKYHDHVLEFLEECSNLFSLFQFFIVNFFRNLKILIFKISIFQLLNFLLILQFSSTAKQISSTEYHF